MDSVIDYLYLCTKCDKKYYVKECHSHHNKCYWPVLNTTDQGIKLSLLGNLQYFISNIISWMYLCTSNI